MAAAVEVTGAVGASAAARVLSFMVEARRELVALAVVVVAAVAAAAGFSATTVGSLLGAEGDAAI